MPSQPVAGRRRRRRLSLALAATALAASLAPAASSQGAVASRSADMSSGSLSQFDQLNVSTGALTASSTQAAGGTHSARATYSGGGQNGYARGLFNVDWVTGDEVVYSAAFFLPVGFKSSMQGQVSLMRWDNWPDYGSDADNGGIAIWGSDKRARLFRSHYGSTQDTLVGPFDLPEGRWFTLSVRQRFSGTNPYSEVLLDGRLIGTSTQPNYYGRAIKRMRYGIVAIGAGAQMNPLTLYFDDAAVRPPGALADAPIATNAPPTVQIVSPTEGQTIVSALDARAQASDDRGVREVVFAVDGKAQYTDSAAPYAWSPTRRWLKRRFGGGRHTIGVTAFDTNGLKSSDSVGVNFG